MREHLTLRKVKKKCRRARTEILIQEEQPISKMGWFSGDEIVSNNAALPTESNASMEQVLTMVAVFLIAITIIAYLMAKSCNKLLASRMSTAVRREVELNNLNNGIARNV